jgi:hypothetical protein
MRNVRLAWPRAKVVDPLDLPSARHATELRRPFSSSSCSPLPPGVRSVARLLSAVCILRLGSRPSQTPKFGSPISTTEMVLLGRDVCWVLAWRYLCNSARNLLLSMPYVCVHTHVCVCTHTL